MGGRAGAIRPFFFALDNGRNRRNLLRNECKALAFSNRGRRAQFHMESSMGKSSLTVLGAALLVGIAGALPAHADVHQIGSVHVAADHYTDVSWEHFEGPVEKLQFV